MKEVDYVVLKAAYDKVRWAMFSFALAAGADVGLDAVAWASE